MPDFPDLYTLHRLSLTLPGQPLFAALSLSIAGLSRHQARQAVSAGLVRVDGKLVSEPKWELGERSEIVCDLRHGIKKAFIAARTEGGTQVAGQPFTILHEDSSLVIIDKSAGISSAPMERGEHGHIPELLRRTWRKRGRDVKYIGIVHRLDKDTSGCLCFALTREAHRLLSAQFASHAASRVYRCLVGGVPRKDADTLEGRIAHGRFGRRVLLLPDKIQEEDVRRQHRRSEHEDDESEDVEDDFDVDEERRPDEARGKSAVTHFKVLRRFARAAELEVTLETGRTHQIRVSLAAIGCPVLGDHVYGFRGPDRRLKSGEKPLVRPPRLMLHAHRLALDHPSTGERLEVEAPIPKIFAEVAKGL